MLTITKSKGLKKSIKVVLLICLLSFGFSFHSSIAAHQNKPQTSSQSVLAQKETDEAAKEVNIVHDKETAEAAREVNIVHDKETAEAAREVNIVHDRNHLITEVLAAGINSDHALKYFETEFEIIKWIYIIATGLLALGVTIAGIVGFKGVRELRQEVREDIKDARQEMRGDANELRKDADERRRELEKLTVKTEGELTNLRKALEEEQRKIIKDTITHLEDQFLNQTTKISNAETARQDQVNKHFETLNRKINEEFNEAVRISECYATVVMFDCVKKGFVDSMAEKQISDSSLEPVKNLLQKKLPVLIKIISYHEDNYHEDNNSDPKGLAKLYGLRANFEKRLEKFTEALFSVEKALTFVSKTDDVQRKAGCQYNAACYASLCNLKEKALDYLEQAINSNPDYRKVAKNELDFENIAKESRFIKLTS